LLDPSLSAPGAIRGEKIVARVRELVEDALIEDLPVPFTAVATDLLGRKEVWFQRGPLHSAIRASIAIPGIITPVMLNGRLLADGGVLNPVPIAATAGATADLTIAVSLEGAPIGDGGHEELGAPVQETAEVRPVEEWTDRFRSSASQLLDRDVVRSILSRFGSSGEGAEVGEDGLLPDPVEGEDGEPPTEPTEIVEELFGPLPAGLGKFDVMNRSIEAMQTLLTRYRLAGYPPDLLVEVPGDACRSLDFHRADEMIALGRTLTAEALDHAGLLPVSTSADDPPDPEGKGRADLGAASIAAPPPQDG
ncbi:MAG: patatin-like phospholipase family protein, partial [Iamia sp.]